MSSLTAKIPGQEAHELIVAMPDNVKVVVAPVDANVYLKSLRSSAAEDIASGTHVVIMESPLNTPTVNFVRGQPVIGVPTNLYDAESPPRVSVRGDRRSAHLKIYLPDNLCHETTGLSDELGQRYANALRNAESPLLFLEHVRLASDRYGTHLELELNNSDGIKNVSPQPQLIPASWSQDAHETFSFDPRHQTNSLLLEHELKKRGVRAKWVSSGFVIAEKDGESLAYNVSSSHRTSQTASKVVGDKNLTRILMRSAEVEVADGKFFGRHDQIEEALDFFTTLDSAVIKPLDGSKGTGVTVNITDANSFRNAWRYAFLHSHAGVLVESHFNGTEARFLVVGNECVAVARRLPPEIVGDGVSTLQTLINAKNNSRRQNPHLYNRPIVLTKSRLDRMASHALTPLSILRHGERYVIDYIGGFSTGADSFDITDDIHPSYKQVAIDSVNAIPGLSMSGVDLLVKDFAEPASSGNYIVIELNSQPGLGSHHFPVHGKARNAAGRIIENDLQGLYALPSVNYLRSSKDIPLTRKPRPGVRLLAASCEDLGLSVEWLHDDYFLAHGRDFTTNFWGTYSSLTSKAAVTATLNTRLSHRLLRRAEVPLPRGRIFPTDREGEFLHGEDALTYARSLGGTATLRFATRSPVVTDVSSPQEFRKTWGRLSLQARHGILVERQRRGTTLRFLLVNGEVLSVVRRSKTHGPTSLEENVHATFKQSAQKAAAAFPGLDICEVAMICQDPSGQDATAAHRLLTVRSNPDLMLHSLGDQQRAEEIAKQVVSRHLHAIRRRGTSS